MKNCNYDNTPSFYNSQEVFEKYLGQTSYYGVLQSNVIKLCKLAKAKNILELGSATGATSFAIASAMQQAKVTGMDMRGDIIAVANEIKSQNGIENANFVTGDFCTYDKFNEYDFIVMLYSFHHIVDPDSNKWNFLKKVYDDIEEESYLCIAETFLPCDRALPEYEETTKALWKLRVSEGEASTFWSALNGLEKTQVKFANDVGAFCGEYEGIAGDEVIKRETEFLLTTEQLCEKAQEAGWTVVVNHACNAVGESIVLLKK